MKRWLVIGALVLVVGASAWVWREWRAAVRTVADSSYVPKVAPATFTGARPVLVFDEAHRNAHRLSGTYAPFGKLAEASGVAVKPLRERVTAENLAGAAALMIVTAQGPADPGDQPAFSEEERTAIVRFVTEGGGLILVTDHYPFADAMQSLANAFGVELSRGMTFDAEHADKSVDDESQLVFSRANGLLAVHPIMEGKDGHSVGSVVLFTGTSMTVPAGATALLRTGANATDLIPSVQVVEDGGDKRTLVDYTESRPTGGRAMGIVLEHGRGRVAVLGDSAMLTAQYDRKTSRRFGFTTEGCDNERFAANLLRWVVEGR